MRFAYQLAITIVSYIAVVLIALLGFLPAFPEYKMTIADITLGFGALIFFEALIFLWERELKRRKVFVRIVSTIQLF